MTKMVRFQSSGATYCLPVAATRAVRVSTGMVTLPAPGTDVAGIIPGNPPLTVIAPLGTGGTQILVIEADDKTFGLLVDTVIGLQQIADCDIHPAPSGQDRPLICGTVESGSELVLVADPAALAGRL